MAVIEDADYSPECRAKTLTAREIKPLDFSICQTNEAYRRNCKFARDLGHGIVICKHPLHAEIVARTVAADNKTG